MLRIVAVQHDPCRLNAREMRDGEMRNIRKGKSEQERVPRQPPSPYKIEFILITASRTNVNG